MGAHSDVVFQIADGKLVRRHSKHTFLHRVEDEDDCDDDEESSEEFTGCSNGWYWQHRRFTSGYIENESDIGEAFGPLRGPFATEDEAAHDRKQNSSKYGVGRLSK